MKKYQLVLLGILVLAVCFFFYFSAYTVVIMGVVYGSIIIYQLDQIKKSIDRLHEQDKNE